MFTTSLTTAVVAGLFASGSIGGLPEWTESYGKAIAMAGDTNKPVAVFLTPGTLSSLTNGKGLKSDVMKSLKDNYVAVQIDTTTDEGKKLAGAFGMTQGVVLSGRSGQKIALRHEGSVSPEQVAEYLTKYSNVSTVVTTEYHTSVVPVVQYQPTVYQYQPTFPTADYQRPRPVINAIQNVGGAIQNVGGVVFSPFVGNS